ncbi:hypothetical protein M3Y97_00224800 [Aphelenchoides bicaudatus]|nr:hypothetical protein M3Y97_00224800 [Aphelenchoides bicaudatus]
MSDPNEKRTMSSDNIQWITEPAASEEPVKEIEKLVEPVKSYEPVESTKSYEPVEPVKSYEPVESTKSYEPVEPTKSYEPVEPTKSYEPVEPTKSYEPIEPSASSSKASGELDKKLRTIELSDEDEEYALSAVQVEKDENGFQFYKCRFCGLTFNFMSTLKAHERVHQVECPYLCPKCNESFHFLCELEYHAKSHEKQKGYKCDCGRTFFQYTDLLYHRHPGEDDPPEVPLPAPLPPARSFSRPLIDPAEFPTPEFAEKGFEPKHQIRVYSEVRSKPYICQYCSKSYSDSRQLAYHMYSHRGERTFNPRASRYLMARNEYSYISPGADVPTPYV